MTQPTRKTADRFLNRELAQIAFNRRVLALAADARIPALERLRFLCIVAANLDEMFEIRVAGLKEQIKLGGRAEEDGLPPVEVLRRLARETRELVAEQYAIFDDAILPALRAAGVVFPRREEWTEEQRVWIADYFARMVRPVLTPIGLDPAHPFPRVLNKSLNFVVELSGTDDFGRNGGHAIVQAPRALPRIVALPGAPDGVCAHVFLSSIMHRHVGDLFPGMEVLGCHQFRVTRNSDLFVDDEEVKDLRAALQGELPQRHLGAAVRLELAAGCRDETAEFLRAQFDLDTEDVYRVPGVVNLARLVAVPGLIDRPDLKYPPFRAGLPAALAGRYDIFAALRKGDVLLHHPFQSFAPVVELLRRAADDPRVVAIKITLYRIGNDSELLGHLLRAAGNGKEVTVVVELMARFDEEANLAIAARLEEVGAHVVYGVFGYKTLAKMLAVTRREESGYRHYVHLGTGNYHLDTTREYTDFGLLTCNDGIAADVAKVFKQITGMSRAAEFDHLWLAPFTLRTRLLAAIGAEADAARAGRPARIVAKMNSLLDPEIVEALYAASAAGVAVDLVVRGACALRPGVSGLSENIRVRSVLGRFLEHSRIMLFHADGREHVYLSSADWMPRNFNRRIEIAFPVLDAKLKRRVLREGLLPYLADTRDAWEMDGSGAYRSGAAGRRKTARSTQNRLLAALSARD